MNQSIGSNFQSLTILSFTSGSIIVNSIVTLNNPSTSSAIQQLLQTAVDNNANGASALGIASINVTLSQSGLFRN